MATARPDLGAAIMTHLKSISDVSTIVANRIYLEWPSGLVVPTSDGKYLNAILINAGLGGEEDVGAHLSRVDIKCYGANKLTAKNIWSIVDWNLLGGNGRTKTSFSTSTCTVLSVLKENGPLDLVDPDAANWRFTVGTYIFRYIGQRNV